MRRLMVAGLLLFPACSFIQNRPSQPSACQTRWPALDAAGAVGWTIGAVLLAGLRVDPSCASDDAGCFKTQEDKDGAVATFGVLAAVQAVSGLYGAHRVSQCGDGGFTPPTEEQDADDSPPGSCMALVASAAVDGINGRGTSAQTLSLQRRCELERGLAETRRSEQAELAHRERMRNLEDEHERAQAEQEAELARAQAELARARAELARANQGSGRSGGQIPPGKLLLFGGHDHKTFLGCLCSEFESDSVLNEYGTYGSEYSSNSIWNNYSEYGPSYSSTSPCSTVASDPPVVVTEQGAFVGFLTINEYKSGAITDSDVLAWLKNKVCKE